jgi:hypothetical protein
MVLFCDMVGLTKLACKLAPETLQTGEIENTAAAQSRLNNNRKKP